MKSLRYLIFRVRKDWFFHTTQLKLKGWRKHFLFQYHDWLYRELYRVRVKELGINHWFS